MSRLAPRTNLFLGHDTPGAGTPARVFRIKAVSDFSKRAVRTLLAGITQANIAVRNFPQSADDLRRRLHLRDGGDSYIFATTDAQGKHLLILCKRVH